MNKSKLKSYAPSARRDFIQAVTDRAHFFGLSANQTIPAEESGDFTIIGGNSFPRSVGTQRKMLEARIKRDGFSQVMESVAYTWFNRFLALRYMELHGYLEHGFRVLSNTGSSTVPEILDHATQIELPGLNKQKVIDLKLDGSKDAELYRILLVAQCNALHSAMPFLFEKIEDETELLLPDNLLHSDSLIRKLVAEIEEEDWQEVEIIGWLYQFYISEKKDEVIGKVVKSEDIPAATQLFTPNWIVKYMVQNSLGRKWLATYPDSPLKAKIEYYIEPAEQTAEVNAQLAAITPSSLNPEELTLLDPACGSGHILVEAYDVFKEIYLERGYSNRDFPRLILEKNLYGLDIDDRAAQMAGFALLMKARKDDRRILKNDNTVKLNVMAIQESGDISINSLPRPQGQGEGGVSLEDVAALVDLFTHGKTFGSLIQVPKALGSKLPQLEEAVKKVLDTGDLYAVDASKRLLPLVEQANVLAGTYDCVVANPPYMGDKYFNVDLKSFSKTFFKISKSDLFSMFIEQSLTFTGVGGYLSLITMQNWMFLPSFKLVRSYIIEKFSIMSLVHIGFNSFPELNSKVALASAFVIKKYKSNDFTGKYIDLNSSHKSADKQYIFNNNRHELTYNTKQNEFCKIPSRPIAYWVSNKIRNLFSQYTPLSKTEKFCQGMATTDNVKYLRLWYEVPTDKINYSIKTKDDCLNINPKWVPYNKGGGYRKWYGNLEYVVNWHNNGADIRLDVVTKYPYLKGNTDFVLKNNNPYFESCLTWTDIGLNFGARYLPEGFMFDVSGSCVYSNDKYNLLAFLGTNLANYLLHIINPTLHYQIGDVSCLPNLYTSLSEADKESCSLIAKKMIELSKEDWDAYEISWDFTCHHYIRANHKKHNLSDSADCFKTFAKEQLENAKQLELKNNHIFINSLNLRDEFSLEFTEDQIPLTKTDTETDVKSLISYAIGCMMGRYSLDQPGLIYANSGNIGFDPTRYQTFPADDDGIVPVMDMDWFPDDAASRFEEFLKVTWSPETIEENMKFVADSLSPKGGETPRETIRRYISTQFFKDHLQTYKKRPIYWLFSSGKQRAFECLVYLHRYNESTLSRMRNEYVTPLQGKFSAQADYLSGEINAASSTAERNRLQKQLDTLRKKQAELASFDDLLRHYADQRISLDLDDGVKVNYGRFGALLAEVKAVTGGGE